MEEKQMENLISNETHRRPKGMGSVYSLGKGRSKPWVASITTGRNQRTGKQIQTPLGYFKTKEQAEDCLILAYMKDKNIMPEDIKDVPVLENKYLQFIYSMMDQHILPNDVREIEDASIINSLFLVKIQQEGLNIKQENAYAKSIKVPTVKDIWLNLLDSDLKHLTKRSLTNYKTSFNNIKILHNKKINLISYSDIQPIFDKLMKEGTGQSKMNNIKIVLNYIFKYAMKYDYIEKNYASFIKFEDTLEEKQNKIPFTKKNIKDLLKHDDDPIVQSILIMIYTGMRPSELLEIKKKTFI